MPGIVVTPASSPPPLAPYSPGVRTGNLLFVSGMLSLDAKGAIVGVGDVRAQTERVLENVRAVIEAAGGAMQDVVHNAIFLKDLADYAAMNEVYRRWFSGEPPARYCIRADLVKPEFLVEISTVASLSS